MFTQPIFNSRERPMTDLLNAAGSNATLREFLRIATRYRASNLTSGAGSSSPRGVDSSAGFFSDAFLPYLGQDGFSVGVTAGAGFYRDPSATTPAVNGVSGLSDPSAWQPIVLGTDVTLAIPAADPANPRIDIIEARVSRDTANPSSRPVLDALTGVFAPNSVDTQLTWEVDGSVGVTTAAASTLALSYRRGTAAVTPASPDPSPGYVAIAYVYVDAAATSITDNDIFDWRPIALPDNGLDVVVNVAYVGGATGGLSSTLVHAPPGVHVEVTDTGADAGFDVVVKCGNPNNIFLLPVAAGVSGSASNLMVCEMETSAPAPAGLPASPYWSMQCKSRVITAGGGGAVSYAVTASTRAYVHMKIVPQGTL